MGGRGRRRGTCVGRRIGLSVDVEGLKGIICGRVGEFSGEGEVNAAIECVMETMSCWLHLYY